jgi:hypothetical protein
MIRVTERGILPLFRLPGTHPQGTGTAAIPDRSQTGQSHEIPAAAESALGEPLLWIQSNASSRMGIRLGT